jgi:hypothetical protein
MQRRRRQMIYIATHKQFIFNNTNGYCLLQVGSEGKASLGYIPDNTGSHISSRNKMYCELTGAYWIWKNSSENIKGLVHYRRYFGDSVQRKILSYSHVNRILSKYEVILRFEKKLPQTVLEDYCTECGFNKDMYKVREIMLEKYPEYVKHFDEFLAGNKIRFFNMIVAREEVFDDYSEWLFDILFDLEKSTDISEYNDYQKRIMGFMSERLLNVYFRKNKYKIFECGVFLAEEKWSLKKRLLTGIKRKVLYIYQMYFRSV